MKPSHFRNSASERRREIEARIPKITIKAEKVKPGADTDVENWTAWKEELWAKIWVDDLSKDSGTEKEKYLVVFALYRRGYLDLGLIMWTRKATNWKNFESPCWVSSTHGMVYSIRGLERSEFGGPKGALGSHEIRPIHSAPSLGQSIESIPSPFCISPRVTFSLQL